MIFNLFCDASIDTDRKIACGGCYITAQDENYVKHTDTKKHAAYTGQPNERILENVRRLVSDGANVTVRVPVIPTFNDTEEEIASIARFASSVGVKELHLLPYHRLGYDKYVGLGREYLMGDLKTPDADHMERLKQAAERQNVTVKIGG